MKKLCVLIAAAFMILGLTACAAKKSDTLIVGLDDSFPPMGFRDDNNQIVGFDIDLAKAAAEKMGVEVTFQPIDWNSKELELNNKKIDLLWNGVTINAQREKEMLFTKPYLLNKQVIMVKIGSDITEKSALVGKKVGVQAGSTAVDAVADDPIYASIGEVLEYADNIAAFMDLDIGRIDAVVCDEIVVKYYISQNQGKYITLSEDFGDEAYGVAMRLGNTDLQSKLQKALDEIYADGTAAGISEKWFGENILQQ